MLRPAGLLFIIGALGVISGCAVGSSTQAVGVEYAVEQATAVQPGMTEEEVIRLLGKPYAREHTPEGLLALRYEFLVTTMKTFSYGAGVTGVTGSRSLSGGKARILLDPRTRTVKSVEYEIQGAARYEKLRREGREKSQ